MSNIEDAAGELRAVAFVLRRLGALRRALSYDECLRVGELLRDCADAVDHGQQVTVIPVTPAANEPAPPPEQPPPKIAPGEVQVAVRQVASRRPPPRPARPRKTVAVN
jgi:hypothetical protein